jgi:hypothetical protein
MIDANEAADPQAAAMLGRLWQRLGQTPHYPIKISELAQAFQPGATGQQRGGPASTTPTPPAGMSSLSGMGFGTTSPSPSTTPAGRPGTNLPAGPPSGKTGLKGPGAPSTANVAPPPKTLGRLHTPAELRPAGLPKWFTDKDPNCTGQITMAQYATTWTAQTLAEFNKYDLNRDGIITAEEVLKVEGPAKPAPAATAAVARAPVAGAARVLGAAAPAAPAAGPPAAPAAPETASETAAAAPRPFRGPPGSGAPPPEGPDD